MAVNIKYFVHGTTTDNEQKKSTGWLGGVLSEKGIKQGRELVQTIKNEKFDVVFSSDLTRAIESAKLNFNGRKIKMLCDERLRECNYGDFNGKDSKLADYSKYIEIKFPCGESLKDVETRIADFCKMLKQKYNGKKVAIVAHRAPQLALEVLLNNKTWQQALESDWRNSHAWQPGWSYIIKS